MITQKHVLLVSVSTSFLADRLLAILEEAKIEAFGRAGGASSNDLVSAASPGFVDVMVEEGKLAQARTLVATELADIERDGEMNARAAEEESMSGENPVG